MHKDTWAEIAKDLKARERKEEKIQSEDPLLEAYERALRLAASIKRLIIERG